VLTDESALHEIHVSIHPEISESDAIASQERPCRRGASRSASGTWVLSRIHRQRQLPACPCKSGNGIAELVNNNYDLITRELLDRGRRIYPARKSTKRRRDNKNPQQHSPPIWRRMQKAEYSDRTRDRRSQVQGAARGSKPPDCFKLRPLRKRHASVLKWDLGRSSTNTNNVSTRTHWEIRGAMPVDAGR